MLNLHRHITLLSVTLVSTACIPKGLLPTCTLVYGPEVDSPEPIALEWDGKTAPSLLVTVIGQSQRDDAPGEWNTSEALALTQVESSQDERAASQWTLLTRELSGKNYGNPNRIEVGKICTPVDAVFTFELQDGLPPGELTNPEAVAYAVSGSISGPHDIELWNGWLVVLDIFDIRT